MTEANLERTTSQEYQTQTYCPISFMKKISDKSMENKNIGENSKRIMEDRNPNRRKEQSNMTKV